MPLGLGNPGNDHESLGLRVIGSLTKPFRLPALRALLEQLDRGRREGE